jgi:hypothetical protein
LTLPLGSRVVVPTASSSDRTSRHSTLPLKRVPEDPLERDAMVVVQVRCHEASSSGTRPATAASSSSRVRSGQPGPSANGIAAPRTGEHPARLQSTTGASASPWCWRVPAQPLAQVDGSGHRQQERRHDPDELERQAPPTNPAPEPADGQPADPWPTSSALSLAPGGLVACPGVHRPPVPRAGQTARPGTRKGGTMTDTLELHRLRVTNGLPSRRHGYGYGPTSGRAAVVNSG